MSKYVERLRKIATCIYIAVEQGVAEDISNDAKAAADHMERLESFVTAYDVYERGYLAGLTHAFGKDLRDRVRITRAALEEN